MHRGKRVTWSDEIDRTTPQMREDLKRRSSAPARYEKTVIKGLRGQRSKGQNGRFMQAKVKNKHIR